MLLREGGTLGYVLQKVVRGDEAWLWGRVGPGVQARVAPGHRPPEGSPMSIVCRDHRGNTPACHPPMGEERAHRWHHRPVSTALTLPLPAIPFGSILIQAWPERGWRPSSQDVPIAHIRGNPAKLTPLKSCPAQRARYKVPPPEMR